MAAYLVVANLAAKSITVLSFVVTLFTSKHTKVPDDMDNDDDGEDTL